MCLGVPMRVVRLDGSLGVVESGGVELEISLALIDDPRPGDHVLVHAGYAIQKIDQAEALQILETLRELARVTRGGP